MELRHFSFLFFLLLCSFGAKGFAQQHSYTYHSDTEGIISDTTWVLEPKEDYLEIKGKNSEGETLIECAPDYTFDRYFYNSSKESSQHTFIREGNILYIETNINGKKKSLHHLLKRNPWIQQLGFGLKGFASSKKKTYYFCILSEQDYSLHDMVAKKDGVFPLTVGDKEYKAQKIHLTLTGFKSMFWSAELWYDTATGDYLLYKGNEGPSTPLTVITLSAKKIMAIPKSTVK